MPKFENPDFYFNTETRTLVNQPHSKLTDVMCDAKLADHEADLLYSIFISVYGNFKFEVHHLQFKETQRKNYHEASQQIFMENTYRYLQSHFPKNKRLRILIDDLFPSLFEQKNRRI